MIEIVINYDESRKEYKIYEPSTDTLMVSSNLTEALTILNKFLLEIGCHLKHLLLVLFT